MKISFDNELSDYQQAKQLQLILEHYAASKCGESAKALINQLNQEIEPFLAHPAFEKFQPCTANDSERNKTSMFDSLSAIWNGFMGPSRLEVKLNEQRRQLIERAERAESMSFEALAETAEAAKERDEALEKIKRLEEQLEAK